MWLAAKVGRSPIDDVSKVCLYRPDLFGRDWLALVRAVLRARVLNRIGYNMPGFLLR